MQYQLRKTLIMWTSFLNLLDMVACKSYDSFYKNTTRICGITISQVQIYKRKMNKYCKNWFYHKPLPVSIWHELCAWIFFPRHYMFGVISKTVEQIKTKDKCPSIHAFLCQLWRLQCNFVYYKYHSQPQF